MLSLALRYCRNKNNETKSILVNTSWAVLLSNAVSPSLAIC